jgi:hypothetical protein
MLIATLGTLGIGLGWGWLGAYLTARAPHTRRTVVAFTAATAAVAVEVAWLVDARQPILFIAAILVAFFLFFSWRSSLRDRFGPS